MDNLTDRLRGSYAVGPNGVYCTRSFGDFRPPISLEAADRIDKLEQALYQLYYDSCSRSHGTHADADKYAKEKIEEILNGQ